MFRILLAITLLLAALCGQVTAKEGEQSTINPSAARTKYPRIVLYSVAWCPHCREVKEYFNSHNIPYINKDVEVDDRYMKELTEKYKSQAVPVIVIGNDKVILRGFNREKFEKAIEQYQKKK